MSWGTELSTRGFTVEGTEEALAVVQCVWDALTQTLRKINSELWIMEAKEGERNNFLLLFLDQPVYLNFTYSAGCHITDCFPATSCLICFMLFTKTLPLLLRLHLLT